MKIACVVVLATLFFADVAEGQAMHAAFVTTVGKDTLCLEQYSRNGNVVSGTWVVFHPPGVYAHDYSITLGPDGFPVRYAMKYTTPGAAAKPDFDSVLVEYGRDTASYTLLYKDSTVRRRVPMRDAFPVLGQSWVGLELALGRLRRTGVDSGALVTNAPTQPSAGATRFPVRFLRGDSIMIGDNRAVVSADGSLLGLVGVQLVVHRVSTLDMPALVKSFVDAFAPRAAAIAAAAASRVEVTIPADKLDRLVGEYFLNAHDTVAITRDGQHLVLSVPGGGRVVLLAQSQTQFFLRKPDLVLVFDVDPQGVATAVTLVQGERRQHLPKIAK
jgi:hypothetical protein